MSAALLADGPGNDRTLPPNAVPIELRREDSLRRIALPVRPLSAAMIGIVAGSLVAHLAIFAATIVSTRAATTAPKEIAVEIVQEEPKTEAPKTEGPKTEATKPAPPRKTAEVKPPEAAKPAAPPSPPKTAQAKAEPPKPAPQEDLAAMQRELDQLKAQQAALQAEARPEVGSGAMRGAQGIALPSISGDGSGDAIGYQELVFSQLAKAKDSQLDNYHGEAGTTGVRFVLDDAGKLVSIEVAASSGKPRLDAQALDIIRAAAPFPPPPKDGEHTFTANVNFKPPQRS